MAWSWANQTSACRWIGLIFSENDELPPIEVFIYYVEHFFTSFGGPLVLSLSGRFDPVEYAAWPLPVAGFHLFTVYMRYVLTPLSQLSWANLNHTLCGVENDPFYALLELGHTYYFWADFYLLFSCYVGLVLNYAICRSVSALLDVVSPPAKTAEARSSGKAVSPRK